MNNRFKFRVWDKLAKRMIYPHNDNQQHFIIDLNGRFHNLQNGSGGDDYVIQQYTGLNDKNNIEVYEGDILEFSNHIDEYKIGYVGFTAGSFYVNFLDDTDEEIAFLTTKDAKIIGNIFNNVLVATIKEYMDGYFYLWIEDII